MSGAEDDASRFAIVWWGYDWRESRGDRVRSLQPLVFPGSAESLLPLRRPPVLSEAQMTTSRHVEVGTPAVVVEDESARGIGLAITAPVTVTSATRRPVVGRWAMEVFMVPAVGRWLVAAVDQ